MSDDKAKEPDLAADALDDWEIAQPILRSQVEAALELREVLSGWRTSFGLLNEIRALYPGETFPPVLARVMAVNTLYNAQLKSVVGMAKHLESLHASSALNENAEPWEVVMLIALAGTTSPDRNGCQVFASKYAHFCLDAARFPIYDQYALKALLCHWGSDEKVLDRRDSYERFCRLLARVTAASGIGDVAIGDLDAYLWLAGVYREWRIRSATARINQECREAFARAHAAGGPVLDLLQRLVPQAAFFELLESKRGCAW